MTKVCCGTFEKYARSIDWMILDIHGEEVKYIMPHIISNKVKYRVNYCPTCGKEIRDIKLTQSQFDKINSK